VSKCGWKRGNGGRGKKEEGLVQLTRKVRKVASCNGDEGDGHPLVNSLCIDALRSYFKALRAKANGT